MRMKSIFFLAVLFIVVLAAAPMTVMAETEAEQARVGDLLPAYEGYRWGVLGFVDYGHDLWVTSIEMKEDETLYNLEGAVHDLSGGEADADFSIRMEYRVTSEVLLQVKVEETMMDSKFDRIELIRAPLEEGHSWTQEVTDPDGTERMLECTIAEVSGRPGSRVYTVRYEDPDSDYYEEREIGEGAGVLSFERFMSGKEEDYTVHYDLFEDNTGVELDLDFTDVEAGDWYAETVSRMTVMDILTGYPDGTFRPGQDISVAEFITVAVETLGFEEDAASEAWEQVENYYEIRDGELVLVPRDGPVMLIEDEPYRLERVHPLQTRLVQETVTDMIADYTMEITHRMGDGQWLMDNRDVTVVE